MFRIFDRLLDVVVPTATAHACGGHRIERGPCQNHRRRCRRWEMRPGPDGRCREHAGSWYDEPC